VPAVSIVNPIIFARLKDPEEEYGLTSAGA